MSSTHSQHRAPNSLRLLVLGASGGVGSWFTRLAAERGHSVTAIARPGALVSASGVDVKRGDVTDPRFLGGVVPGHHAVVSCLGLRRAGKSPFAKLLSPPDLTERVTRTLVDEMQNAGIRDLAVISAGGVRESFDRLTWPVRKLVTTGNVAIAYRDLANMEAIVERSGLDYLIVRPVTLMGGDRTGRAGPVERYGLFSIIRRADVAAWTLDALERGPDARPTTAMIGA